MKKLITVVFFSLSSFVFSQEKAVDVFSVKTGFIGAWISYEKALNDKFTLDAEIGYEGGFLKGTDNNIDYVFTTTFSLEPKYYYNFNRREKKGKKTINNSANYISSEIYYVPNLLSSTNRNNIEVNKSFGFLPKYGLRRSISESLTFEFAVGIGYVWGENNINTATFGLDLRLNLNL